MPDELDQLAVIRGLKNGQRDAWTALYDQYNADVWRLVARLSGADTHAVGDVVQEVFLAAARSASQFDPTRGTVWAWLAGIAQRQVYAWWRQAQRAARVKQLAQTHAADFGRWLAADPAADAIWQQRELCDLVRYVLSEMPPDYALLLTGKYIDQLSLEALADRWGGSVDAVKSRLARARQDFRAKFARLTREPHSTSRT